METPVSLFAKWGCESSQNSFLLESVEGGEKLGRNSFLGKTPSRLLQGKTAFFMSAKETNLPQKSLHTIL